MQNQFGKEWNTMKIEHIFYITKNKRIEEFLYMINIEEFKKIRTQNYMIVLDTNIFLELYRQPANISLDIIQALKQVRDHLFIPRQVYDEYIKNYQTVCGSEKKKYQKVSKELSESIRKLQEDIHTKMNEYRKHNYTDISKLQNDLNEKIANIQDIIKIFEAGHQEEKKISMDFLDHDKVKEFLDFLLKKGRVEDSLTYSEKLEIFKEGQLRFELLLPPGYMDDQKEGIDKYGDLLVWKSIIRVAKKTNSNIIFVCNDLKEDWWHKKGEIPMDLREELLEEFKEQNPFLDVHFLTLDKFFSYLSEELQIGNSKSALQLSAVEDARNLLEKYNKKIRKKVLNFLKTIDFEKENGESVKFCGEKVYWNIENVSVEKEEKIITYYINLGISMLIDLISDKEDEDSNFLGEQVLDITGEIVLTKEEYSTVTNIEKLDLAMNDTRQIEPEIWNAIKNENMSAKQLIKENDGLEQQKNTLKLFINGDLGTIYTIKNKDNSERLIAYNKFLLEFLKEKEEEQDDK